MEVDLETPKGETTWTYIHYPKQATVIVPIDDEGNTYIKREWRLNKKDFSWEFASGWIDEAEEKEATEEEILSAANRELQEEIGYKAEFLEHVTSFYISNHVDWVFHVVVAKNLTESSLEGDEHEFVEPKKVSFEEAEKILLKDQVPSGQTIVAFRAFEKALQR